MRNAMLRPAARLPTRTRPPVRRSHTSYTLGRFLMGPRLPPPRRISRLHTARCSPLFYRFRCLLYSSRRVLGNDPGPIEIYGRPFPAARCFSNGCCVVHLMSRWPVVFCLRVFIFAYSPRERERLPCGFYALGGVRRVRTFLHSCEFASEIIGRRDGKNINVEFGKKNMVWRS